MTPAEHERWVRHHGWMTLFWGADPDGVTAHKLMKRLGLESIEEADAALGALVAYWQTFHKILYRRRK